MADMEEAPLMMDDKPASVAGSQKSKTSKAGKVSAKPAGRPKPTAEDYTKCCCCSFQTSDPTSRDQKCFFCFPLKAGIFALIIISFVFVVFELIWLILMSKNKYYSGWYVFFELLALFPAFVSVAFFIYYLAEDTKASRNRVFQGFMLIALAVFLMGLISIIYITGVYSEDRVYIGYGEINEEGEEMKYSSETKKEFVYEQIIIVLAICFFYLINGMSA